MTDRDKQSRRSSFLLKISQAILFLEFVRLQFEVMYILFPKESQIEFLGLAMKIIH